MTNPFGKKAAITFDVDLSDVPENSYYVEPGQYAAKVIGLDRQMSKAGSPMLVVEMALLEGNPGMQMKTWLSLNPKALFKVADFVEAIGLGKRGEKLSIDPVAARNRRCMILIKDDEYNGRTVSRIEGFAEHKDGPLMPVKGAMPKGTSVKQKAAAAEEEQENEKTGDTPF
jgi:hypothetical protein